MEKIIPKIGCFVLDPGGRLGRALDFETLAKKCAKLKGVARFEVIADPWAPAFMDTVREETRAGWIDRFLWVGRWAPAEKKRLVDECISLGVNPHLHAWCDLEEQGLLTKGAAPEVGTRKAQVLIEMALAALRLSEPLDPAEIPSSDAILVVGAGVAGLHTAASLSELGRRVILVEREHGVGGKAALLSRFYPRLCDPHCGLWFVLDQLAKSDRVTLRTSSRVAGISGSPGNFLVSIHSDPAYVDPVRCNGCGACAEACPREIVRSSRGAANDGAYAEGRFLSLLPSGVKAIHPREPLPFPPSYVIEREQCPPDCRACEKACPSGAVRFDQTGSEEEQRVGAVLLTTGWDPYPIERIEEYGYGRFPNVLSNLEMERLLSPGKGDDLGQIRDIGFIQCVGSRDERHLKYCSSVCCSATLKQILHLKERYPEVNCHVFCMEIRSSGFEEELYRKARGFESVHFFRERPAAVEQEETTGKLRISILDTVLDRWVRMSLDLLVLAGGMCPSSESEGLARLLNMPLNEHRFFEAHHQCFPEESQRTGIYVGGCAREPMNVAHSIESAHRAAMKAMCLAGSSVKIPAKYPVLEKTKCDQCKRCAEDCPFSSFLFDEKGFPYPDLARCRQCGNCMGTCPLAAISLRNNGIKHVAAQVQVLEKSFLPKKEPLILAFLCENDAYKAACSAAASGLPIPQNVVSIKVPCAGAVNNAVVADALSLGVDGVLIAGCKDDQCHYVGGSRLVRKRSGDLGDKLRKMKIEPERVRFEYLEIRDSEKYVSLLGDYIESLKKIGPNPFKL